MSQSLLVSDKIHAGLLNYKLFFQKKEKIKLLSDAELVEKFILTKHKNYFSELYRRHVRITYRYIYSRVGNQVIAEDITSETFLTLIDVINKYNFKSKLTTFIVGIAVNKIRQYWDKEKVSDDLSGYEETIALVEESESNDSGEKAKIVNDMVQKLPEKYRNVLIERYLNKSSIKDTAKKLKLSESNVRVIQNRGIKMLKKEMSNL